MHKSKGLEFDSVFLPCLHKGKRPDDSEALYWMERLNQHREADFILSPLARYDASQPDALSQFIRSQRATQNSYETHRVFYVACTRAKKRLYLSATLKPNLDAEPDSGSPWLAPPNASMLARIWPSVSTDFITAPKVSADDQLSEKTPEPSLLALNETWRPIFEQHFYALESAPVFNNDDFDLAALWRDTEQVAAAAGTVFHQVMAQLCLRPETAYQDFAVPENHAWQVLFRQQGIHNTLSAHWIERFWRAVDKLQHNPQAQQILANHPRMSRCEWALSVTNRAKQPSQLVIDRAFIDEQHCLWIIDYKTSDAVENNHGSTFFEQQALLYREQLQRYQRAVRKYCIQNPELAVQEIRCALYFPLDLTLFELNELHCERKNFDLA